MRPGGRGSASAGRLLVDGLSSPDESSRTIAGMFLVRGGERAAPLLDEELEQPRNLPMLLRVMGDTAPERFRPVLERYATSDDPKISRAAQDALRAGTGATRRRSLTSGASLSSGPVPVGSGRWHTSHCACPAAARIPDRRGPGPWVLSRHCRRASSTSPRVPLSSRVLVPGHVLRRRKGRPGLRAP